MIAYLQVHAMAIVFFIVIYNLTSIYVREILGSKYVPNRLKIAAISGVLSLLFMALDSTPYVVINAISAAIFFDGISTVSENEQ